MIKKLHHNAYRCRDSEQTRKFYEEFLGLRLAGTLEITETKSGRQTNALHTFYELGDGSYLAFFEVPDSPFQFKEQHDYDLHIALEVERPMLEKKLAEGKARGIESRGIADREDAQPRQGDGPGEERRAREARQVAGVQEAARARLKRSDSRILTTHAGSLPRPKPLVDLQLRASRGETVAPAELSREAAQATRQAVARQLACGIDVGNDGEQPRESFVTYVRYRLSGFSGESKRPPVQDLAAYPSFRALMQSQVRTSLLTTPPRATGEVRYVDRAPLEREFKGYEKALRDQAGQFVESFWTAPSPGIVACAMQNAHYGSLAEYVDAVAVALRTEYEAIVARGFVL